MGRESTQETHIKVGEMYWEMYLEVTVRSLASSTAVVLKTRARFRRCKMQAMQICCAQHRTCKEQQQVESKADKGLFMLCICMSVRRNRCTQQAALLCPFPFQVLVINGNIRLFSQHNPWQLFSGCTGLSCLHVCTRVMNAHVIPQ